MENRDLQRRNGPSGLCDDDDDDEMDMRPILLVDLKKEEWQIKLAVVFSQRSGGYGTSNWEVGWLGDYYFSGSAEGLNSMWWKVDVYIFFLLTFSIFLKILCFTNSGSTLQKA